MRLRHLKVRHFRGISELDWLLLGDFLCLVGPGDSCKSTILDAIELALLPRWNPQLDDSDFFDGDVAAPIEIEVTLSDLPKEILRESRFGMHLRGLRQTGEFTAEPDEDSDTPAEPVLTIRFEARDDLEPRWAVIDGTQDEGVPIHVRDRQRLGAFRVGAFVERHLTWSHGSVLSTMSGDFDKQGGILAAAGRSARTSLPEGSFGDLRDVARRADILARNFGVAVRAGFSPALDPAGLAVNLGGLSLHDGNVPVRRLGLGSRRLVACAIQREVTEPAGVTLIDELEHGLEPHRVRRLLQALRVARVPDVPNAPAPPAGPDAASSVASAPIPPRRGVTLITTHSPVVVAELEPENLCVVRRTGDGRTSVKAVAASLRPELRKHPEAFLGRRVIVCEGKTEIGFCRGLDASQFFAAPLASVGVVLVDGGGCNQVGKRAQMFARLGYDTSVLADSDQPLDVDEVSLRQDGVATFIWPGQVCIEQAMFDVLAKSSIRSLLEDVRAREDGINFIDRMTKFGGLSKGVMSTTFEVWLGSPEAPQDALIRRALGKAAHAGGWFKRVDLAEPIGAAAACDFESMPGGLGPRAALSCLRAWASSG